VAADREYPGTPLRDEDITEGKVLIAETDPNARYAWDAGIAIGRFLAELKKGRIVGRRCHRCRRTMVPPRMFCEQCFRPTDEWVYLADSGRVNTYSISYIRWDASRVKEPTIPAVIEIDGASKGMGIMHLLGGVKPEDVQIGMRVKAVWKPPRQREGSILDIRYFRPY
jgi:uncharacterized OB-fold protein